MDNFKVPSPIPPPNGRWADADCIAPMAESKTDQLGFDCINVNFDMTCWPHNAERAIPFKALTDIFPEYNPKGQHVSLANGFLTTMPIDDIENDVDLVCVSWREVSYYNANVYGAWRTGKNNSYFIDTEKPHFAFDPLGSPPVREEGHVVFKKNGILRTHRSGDYVENVLGIRDYYDIGSFRYSQWNMNAVGNWNELSDGTGYYVDNERRDKLYIGRSEVFINP